MDIRTLHQHQKLEYKRGTAGNRNVFLGMLSFER